MLNLRKTKKMDVLEDNNKKEYYGTGTDPKKDQKKYEEKVDQFLRYCKNFRDELVERSKNKDKEKGLKTVEDIKKCFDSSFKEYYKKSKKFRLFSRTTKVLKGMDKKLDKIKEVELSENVAQKIKDAFKYTSKRDYEKDYGKRSAIDDKAVYGFFNLTLPKIINNICQKARGEQADELKELNDLMDFVNESFGKVKRLSQNLGKIIKEQGESIDEIQSENKGLQEEAKENDNKKIKSAAAEIEDRIEDVQEDYEKIQEEYEKLEAQHAALNEKYNKVYVAVLNDDVDEAQKSLGAKSQDDVMNKITELHDEIETLEGKMEELNKKAKGNDGSIKEIKRKSVKLDKQLEESKKDQEECFKLENGTLTISGEQGLSAYWADYISNNIGKYTRDVKSIVMKNVGDISPYKLDGWGGIFHSFENLTSVVARDLKKIGNSVFSGCKNLVSFNKGDGYDYNIPEGVKTIGANAFEETGTKVENGFSANVGATTVGGNAFAHSGLKEINLPNATIIGPYAFSGCSKLTKVTLGQNKLKSFKVNAFNNSEKLTIYVKTKELQKELQEGLSKTYGNGSKVKVELI